MEVAADTARFDLLYVKMIGTLNDAHDSIEQLRRERNALRDTNELQRIELETNDYQMKRMVAFMTLNGLHYADVDKRDETV